jgi:hypothetical protein
MLNKKEWIALAVHLYCAAVVILTFGLGLFLPLYISKFHARLLKQPPLQRIWSIIDRIWDNLDLLVSRCRSMSRFCKAFSVSLLVWAYFQLVFALLHHEIFPASSVRIVGYNFILVFIAAGCCFQAACEDLESNLIRLLNPKYVNLLKKLWLLLNWVTIGFRCVDFVPSDLSWAMDCITAAHTFRAISRLINFRFGLQVQERTVLPRSWWNCRIESKPYNPWTFFQINYAVELLGFDAFKFVPFGSNPLHYYWYFVLVFSAVPASIAISFWADDKHILLTILNLALLFAMVPVLSSAAKVIHSSNRYCDLDKKGLFCLFFVMANTLFMFATVLMTRLAQFALEERSSYGWSNIK